ncbi:MAG: citrate transporter [Hyphomicrobium sp.]|nr:citrate transporter [Hyphomicrobium sp.]
MAATDATGSSTGAALFGIPIEFYIFAVTLTAVAVLHHHPLVVAGTGLAAVVAFKLAVTGFHAGPGLSGLMAHLAHESITIGNLFLLLVGFGLLARHFEESKVPEALPAVLPDDWTGGLVLLALIFVLSAFLDNIAAALIGGTAASHVYRGKVHLSYLAAIVAASNAGGSGSVLGDTTTTMMWIDGVSPLDVLHAYVAAVVAFLIFGTIAARTQHAYNPILKDPVGKPAIDGARIGIVAAILIAAVSANVLANLYAPALLKQWPVLGLAVATAIFVTAPIRTPDWSIVPGAAKGAIFLLALVLSASLMPVEALPVASWQTALGLGFVSAIFDNIPLTALALRQGGYDWGFLAFAVGFGGSMVWFGSSAGVALSSLYPESRDAIAWLRAGWHIPVSYVIGFFVMLMVLGWHPHEPHRTTPTAPATPTAADHP